MTLEEIKEKNGLQIDAERIDIQVVEHIPGKAGWYIFAPFWTSYKYDNQFNEENNA